MDFQHWFEAVLALLVSVMAWFMKILWTKQEQTNNELVAHRIEIARHYVTQEQFERVAETLYAKLDKIDDKLDRKQDK
jgi:hypothetical protein